MWWLVWAVSAAPVIARKDIPDCYASSTEVLLDKNLELFLINLEPTKANECYALESGVYVNLTLRADGVICDNITLLLTNFEYENVTTLYARFKAGEANVINAQTVFCPGTSIQNLSQITFAYLQIYTHTDITSLEIMHYGELKSSVQNCFSAIDVAISSDFDIILTAIPTHVCKNIFVNVTSNPASYVEDITILLNSASVVLTEDQLNAFLDSYYATQNISIVISGDKMAVDSVDAPNINARLKISTVQDSTDISIIYDANFTKNTNNGFFVGTFYYIDQDAFFIKFEATEQRVAEINQEVFAYYKARIAINNNYEYITYITLYESSQYDPSNTIIHIRCAQQIETEQEKCHQFYTLTNEDFTTKVTLDILFYNSDNKLSMFESIVLQRAYNCLDNVYIRTISESAVRVSYTNKSTEQCQQLMERRVVTSLLLVADDSYEGNISHLTIYNASNSVHDPTFSCEDNEFCIKEALSRAMGHTTMVMFIQMYEGQYIYVGGMAPRVTIGYQDITNYTAYTVGGGCVLACLCLMVHGIIITNRRVKQIRRRKIRL